MPPIDYGQGLADQYYSQKGPGFTPNGVRQYDHDTGGAAPYLGGYANGANDLANSYGAQAGQMQGATLSDRFSSQDRPVLDQSRNASLAALDYQRQLATGQAQSPAVGQAQSGLAQAIAAQHSAGASAFGGGSAQALAARNAAGQSAMIAGQGQNDMRALQAQEMAAARDRYAAGVNQLRSQDQSLWGLGQQREMGNAALNDEGALASQGMANQLQGGQLAADASAYGTRTSGDIGQQQALKQARDERDRKMIAAGMGALGGAMSGGAMSDERAKTDIQSAGAPANRSSLPAPVPSTTYPPNADAPANAGAPQPAAAPTDMYGHPLGYQAPPVTWADTGMGYYGDKSPGLDFYGANIGQHPAQQPPPGGAQPPVPPQSTPSGPSQASQAMFGMPMQTQGMRGPSPFGGGGYQVSEGTKAMYQRPTLGQFMSDERTKYVETKPSFPAPPEGHGNASYVKYAAGHAPPAAGSDAAKPHNNYYNPRYGDEKPGSVMSDEDLKSGAQKRADVDAFLDTLHPYSYRYKDPSNEPTAQPTGGRYLGVMAQNVERGPTGNTIVKETPKGKMLEGGALMSAMAAGQGRLHERLSALEAKMGKK